MYEYNQGIKHVTQNNCKCKIKHVKPPDYFSIHKFYLNKQDKALLYNCLYNILLNAIQISILMTVIFNRLDI